MLRRSITLPRIAKTGSIHAKLIIQVVICLFYYLCTNHFIVLFVFVSNSIMLVLLPCVLLAAIEECT